MSAKNDDLREKRNGSKKRGGGEGRGASSPSLLSCLCPTLYPPYVIFLFFSPLPQPVMQVKH